jgi:hypothetical protein
VSAKKQVTLIYPGQGEMTGLRKGWIGRHVALRLPLPILFVATPLLKHGYNVKIVDLRLDRFEEHDFSNDICVGISTLTGGQIINALKAVNAVWPSVLHPWYVIVAEKQEGETA